MPWLWRFPQLKVSEAPDAHAARAIRRGFIFWRFDKGGEVTVFLGDSINRIQEHCFANAAQAKKHL
jgi:hypothetical protein